MLFRYSVEDFKSRLYWLISRLIPKEIVKNCIINACSKYDKGDLLELKVQDLFRALD